MKKYTLFLLTVMSIVSVIAVANVFAQRRDYMTDAEIELVRDAQDIDKRIGVLTEMIDRRLTAAGAPAGGWAPGQKGSDKWGPEPEGTKLQLLTDVKFLLQKAIDDIDDVAEHNSNTLTQNKTEGLLFPKAVRELAASAQRYLVPLKAMAAKSTDGRERGVVLASIEFCEQILDAAATLPPEKKKGKG